MSARDGVQSFIPIAEWDRHRDKKMSVNRADITGEPFGRLIAIAPAYRDRWGNIVWLCECTCPRRGQTFSTVTNLRSGIASSCGCSRLGPLHPRRARRKATP